MEWLKAKKNLPVVVALAVFFFLGAAGLIAWELGAFSGSSSVALAPAPAPVAPPGAPPPGGAAPGYPPGAPPPSAGGAPRDLSVRPLRSAPGIPKGLPGKPVAATVTKVNPNTVQPLAVPDPFQIPNGAKKLAQANARLLGPKPPLRDLIGPLNLFQIRPPAPPPPPVVPGLETQVNGQPDPAANYRLSGVITGTDGINAILEVGGQSQTVKPGDSLPDGSQVQNIQTNSITLRTAGGSVINLPLSAGNPDQGNNGPSPYQPGGYNGYGAPPQFNPRQRTDN